MCIKIHFPMTEHPFYQGFPEVFSQPLLSPEPALAKPMGRAPARVTRIKSRGKLWLGLYFNLPMPPPNSSRQTDKNMKDSRVGRSVAWEFSKTHELATVPRLDLLPPGPLWLCYVTLGRGHLEVTLRSYLREDSGRNCGQSSNHSKERYLEKELQDMSLT